MTKTDWEILCENFMDKFWRLLPFFGWTLVCSVTLVCFVLLGFNLRIHDNERYVVKSKELQSQQEVLIPILIETIIELDEYKTIINNLQEHPLALAIIKCESNFNGKAYNKETEDYGYWQINDYWHREPAKERGYDIEDPKENLQYGFEKYLEMNGLRYWNPSKHCWAETKTNEGEE